MQVLSGVLLVSSVLKIRRFFKKNNQADYINTGMLLKHSICFALFIFTTIFYFGALTLWTLNPTPDSYGIVSAIGIVYVFGSLIS
jgi:hypothetical protein